MEGLITLLNKLDAAVVIIIFVIILFAVCYVVSRLIKHRKNISGLLESWFQRKTKQNEILAMIFDDHQQIEKYKENRLHDREQSFAIQQQLTDAIEAISNKLDTIQRNFIEDKIENMRWKILEFGNMLMNGKTCHKEQFDNIFKIYDEYEKILEENDMTNGQVEETMKFIREKYHELINDAFKR